MYVLKVPLKQANSVKAQLISNLLYDKSRIPVSDAASIYYPIKKKDKQLDNLGRYSRKVLPLVLSSNYQDKLKDAIPKILFENLPKSYDIIGDIILVDIKEELLKYQKSIGEALLHSHKSIKTILKKTGIHEGEFRTQKYECIAGIDTREALYKENGVILKLDVEKVYFSPRLSTERKRIFKEIKPNENILVMFSGCAPYPSTISKNTLAKKIIGIEKNVIAHKYGQENLKLNKIKNVELICGDVRNVVPTLNEKFDRIVMPLPKDADTFLDIAFNVATKGTIINLYDFEHETELSLVNQKVELACKKFKIKYKILNVVKCGQYSPGKFRICVDFEIL
ncbi:MAG: class I SAM-dependent methyltransferase family protein [archaeon]